MFRLSPLAFAGALIATSLTVISTTPAQAAARTVSFGDLDLTSATGRATMDHRLHTAASAVCRHENRDLVLASACERLSVAQAQTDLRRITGNSVVQIASR